mgnify:CR=1 FL=1
MKKKISIAAVLLFGLGTWNLELGTWNLELGNSSAQSAGNEQVIPYTLEDRDRAVRMEVQMNERFESMNERFGSMNVRFESMDDKMDKLYTLLYFILGGVFGLIGLIMWDRRSYIRPVKEDIRELQNALRDFAKKQPELTEILRSHGIL